MTSCSPSGAPVAFALALALALFALPTTATAQQGRPSGWQLDLGVGAIVNPERQGGDDYRVLPVPYFDARYVDARGTKYFANVPQGLGGYLYRGGSSPLDRTAVGIAIAPGFATRDDDEIPGLDEVDIATEARLYLERDRGAWSWRATLARDIGSGHEGTWLDLGVQRRGRLGAGGFWAFGPNLRLVDSDYADAQYGVSAAASVTSGLAAHDAGRGLEQLSLQGIVSVPFAERWRATTVLSVGRLLGDRADSPVVQSETQAFGLLAITRAIGGRRAAGVARCAPPRDDGDDERRAEKTVRAPCPEWLEFLSAFDEPVTELAVAARARVLEAAPQANELVYDAYNAVSVAFSFSQRLADAFVHVAAYARHVNLGFNQGATLDDPEQLLIGNGARIRHVKLHRRADLELPALDGLLAQAVMIGTARVPILPSAPRAVVRPTRGAKRRPAPAS